MKIRIIVRILSSMFFLIALGAQAQEKQKSAEEIAKELANPNTALATLNFKLQFRGF